MDGKGRYAGNIFLDRLWRTAKYEHVFLKAYASAGEARTKLEGCIIVKEKLRSIY